MKHLLILVVVDFNVDSFSHISKAIQLVRGFDYPFRQKSVSEILCADDILDDYAEKRLLTTLT